MDKKDIRNAMLEKRTALSEIERGMLSDQIAQHVTNSTIYQQNENICIYQAFRGEVICDKIRDRAFSDGKRVYVPVTDQQKKTMQFYHVKEDTVYREGAYHILEPENLQKTDILCEKALILMPGLVFDKDHHRIGYGGGYYDRYLCMHPEHETAALCFAFQVVEQSLPYEEHDQLPDYIVTEQGFLPS